MATSVFVPALGVGDPREYRGYFRIVYSDLVGYQASDIRLLWTIITQTMNPPPPSPLVV